MSEASIMHLHIHILYYYHALAKQNRYDTPPDILISWLYNRNSNHDFMLACVQAGSETSSAELQGVYGRLSGWRDHVRDVRLSPETLNTHSKHYKKTVQYVYV